MGFRPKVNITDNLTGGNQTTPTTGQSFSSPSSSVFGTVAQYTMGGLKRAGGVVYNVGKSAYNRGSEFLQAAEDTAKNPSMALTGEGMLRGAGALGGFIGDTIGAVIPHEATDALGYAAKSTVKGVKNAIDTVTGNENVSNAISDVASSAAQGVSDFAEAHPRLAKNAGAALDATNLVMIPGAKTLIQRGGKAAMGKVAPFSKWANKLSSIPEDVVNTVSKNPEIAGQIEQLRAGTLPKAALPEIPNIPHPQKPTMAVPEEAGILPGSADELQLQGKTIFDTAQGQKEAAQKAYGESRRSLIDAKRDVISSAPEVFSQGTADVLKKEGIDVVDGVVDLMGSQFEGTTGAKDALQRAYSLMSRAPVEKTGRTIADDLLTRREALSRLMDEIPKEESNLRRIVGNMRSSFDDTLDSMLGDDVKEMRAAYAKTMSATKPILEDMLVDQGGKQVFSQDKAYKFVNDIFKENKFDNRKLLSDLDEVAGTAHSSDIAKIEQGRFDYLKKVEDGKKAVAEINAKAKAEYEMAKDARSKQMIEAKRVRDEAAAVEKAKLDGLKQLNRALSQASPAVTDSLLSITRKYVTGVPVVNKLTPFFTPKFWGDIALSKGLAAGGKQMSSASIDKISKEAQLWLLANILTSGEQSSEGN